MSSTRGNLRGYLERRFIEFFVLIEWLEEIRLLLFNWIFKINEHTEVMSYSSLSSTLFSRHWNKVYHKIDALVYKLVQLNHRFFFFRMAFNFAEKWTLHVQASFDKLQVNFLRSRSTPNNFRLWLQLIKNSKELCFWGVRSDEMNCQRLSA